MPDLPRMRAAPIVEESSLTAPNYHHWLATLERLLTAKGLSDEVALLASKEAWDQQHRFFCATLTEL